MRVILVKDVKGLGRSLEVKEVSDGYARNFLLPRKLAIPATEGQIHAVNKEKAEADAKKAREKENFVNWQKKLTNKQFIIKAPAGKDKLFAAIHENEVVEVIREKTGIDIRPEQIILKQPLKSLGMKEIIIKFSPEYKTTINLEIQPHEKK